MCLTVTLYYCVFGIHAFARVLPEGFVLRKLDEEHAEVVAPYWPALNDLQAKQKLFKTLLKAFTVLDSSPRKILTNQ